MALIIAKTGGNPIENKIAAIPVQSGSYVLQLHLERAQTLPVGRLGQLCFAPGNYLYMGSAWGPGGLRARLGRHLRGDGRLHWHVDTLRAVCGVVGYGYSVASDPRQECRWSQALGALAGTSYVNGFGASDCKTCPAHLVFLSEVGIEAAWQVLAAAAGFTCVSLDSLL
jgi:Uri superfamily endonuclease